MSSRLASRTAIVSVCQSCPATLDPSEDRPQHIGPCFVVARAQTVTDFLGGKIPHRTECLDKFRKQGGPGGCDQLVRLFALRHRDAPRTQDRQCRRGGNREPSVCAINPASPLDHGTREDTRFAQQLQPDAGPYDIHDRIHRPYFVKMNLLRRQAVDFSFRDGDAMENRDGFLLHPIRKGAARNEVLDLGVVSLMFVAVIVRGPMSMGLLQPGTARGPLVFMAMSMLVMVTVFLFMSRIAVRLA